MIGDGPELPALERLAAQLGVAARVEWAGQLPHDDALTRTGRLPLMVLPSVDEAFGVAYVEALACGVPAIGCRGEGGPEEIAAAGDGMVLVPPRDPDALAETIAGLLEQPERLDELGGPPAPPPSSSSRGSAAGRPPSRPTAGAGRGPEVRPACLITNVVSDYRREPFEMLCARRTWR